MRTARALSLLAAALACLALLSGCGAGRAPGARVASSEKRWFGSVSPPSDGVFRFTNSAEPQFFDPGLAAGQPDGRICRMMFEGLTREHPQTLEPIPGQAYRWEVSSDGLIYTFHLRPGITWTDGLPVTAEDFRWSWIRVLRPETAARYAGLIYPIRNAEAFNTGKITDERQVGIAAPDDSTLVVTLGSPTPYFLYLTQFYTCLPVPRARVEKFGPRWVRPENVAGNGAFTLKFWRQNDRFEFVKNPRYWNAASVKLNGVVAYSIDDLNTKANLYKSGRVDWLPSGDLPSQFIPYMRDFSDYRHGSYQGVYFYSINVKRKPLDNPWVRRALNWSIDRDAIANDLLKRSRDPWGNFTPAGYPGYIHPRGFTFDPAKARECLAKAGYPGGRGFPKIAILFNTSEDHRVIAEALQEMWKRELHIEVELSNQEWGSYLAATTSFQYDVARRSWIGDFLDPYTFLGLGRTGDGNNRTGWSDSRYDALLRRSTTELDPVKRMAIFTEAESLLLADGPFIPIYHYSTNEMVKPYVRGILQTALDIHPLTAVEIVKDWRHAPAPLAATLAGRRAAPSALLGREGR